MAFFISDRNIDGNEKLFPPFQVCGNDAVTERSLRPISEPGIYILLPRVLGVSFKHLE